MTRSKLVSGILVTFALGILSSSAGADQHWGPRRVGDKCFISTANGSNGAFGYWETCKAPATGATANARVARPAKKSPSSR
jgi:hypothetical protein